MAHPKRIQNLLNKHKLKGVNKPKKTPNGKKSHIVLAKEGEKYRLVRFGQAGIKGAGNAPKSDKQKARRKSFRARHKCSQNKSKLSASFWSCKVKW